MQSGIFVTVKDVADAGEVKVEGGSCAAGHIHLDLEVRGLAFTVMVDQVSVLRAARLVIDKLVDDDEPDIPREPHKDSLVH